ncbi:MAG TPA: hypothetical protein VFE09_09035 [Rubrobacteraceae bacterium]|nr:hypothetical protein [Rubrobacteraceae bacterium]
MDPGEQTTGTRDEHYNLIAVLYHALHGAENCEIYALDAEAAGREELAAFFREVQGMQVGVAEQAKGLLGILEGAPEVGRYSAGAVPSETEVTTSTTAPRDIPSTTGVPRPPPRGTPGDVERGISPEAPRTGDIPPPGEERPQREGSVSREVPPPGEEEPRPEDPRPGP